ncbi:MAG: tetratricopeptide repeat protein [Elusimicrobiota bacterium]
MKKILFLIFIGFCMPCFGSQRKEALLLSHQAYQSYKQGQYQTAIAQYENSLHLETSSEMRKHIYLYLGKSYESLGVLDKAIQSYEQALDYDPRNWKRHRDLGNLYEKSGIFFEALKSYKRSRELRENEGNIDLAIARIYRKLKLYSEGAYFLKISENHKDSKVEWHKENAYYLEGRGQYSAALREWESFLITDMNDQEVTHFIYLGCLAQDFKRAHQGLELLKQRKIDNKTTLFYENLVELSLLKDPSPSLIQSIVNTQK